MSEKLTLRTNEWVEVAFKWPDGKNLTNEYGDSVLWSLTDGRVLFTPVPAAEKIRALKLNPGERLNIRKAEVNGANGSRPHIEWQVQRVDPPAGLQQGGTLVIPRERAADSIAATHPDAATRIRQQMEAASSPEIAAPGVTITKTSEHANYTPKTKLEDALRTVVHACHSARQYAQEIGYEMPVFNGDELVRLTATILINDNGGRR